MNVAIYSRKSVDTGRGQSIENQVEMCRAYLHDRMPEAAKATLFFYEDEGYSGRSTSRPEFQNMLTRARQGGLDAILCYRLDRISRSVSDFSALIEELNSLGVSFICIREQFDTTTPMGRAMMYVASVFAQLERETIAERVRDNMLMLARSGRWLGGTPPTGYRSVKLEQTTADGRAETLFRLSEHAAEAQTVRTIYQVFLAEASLSGAARALAAKGVCGRKGRFYSPTGLRDILKNPVYCLAGPTARDYFLSVGADVCFTGEEKETRRGLLAYNKRDYSTSGMKRLPPDRWIVAAGAHMGQIDDSDWVRAQKLLGALTASRRPAPISRTANDYAMLSGLLFCGRCGAPMFAKRRSGTRLQFDYICSGKRRTDRDRCSCLNLPGEAADRAALRCIAFLDVDRAGLRRGLSAIRKRLRSSVSSSPDNNYPPVSTPAHAPQTNGALSSDNARIMCALTGFDTAWPLLTIEEKREASAIAFARAEWDGSSLRFFPACSFPK